jgi:broad specificity phosphatase PhoE
MVVDALWEDAPLEPAIELVAGAKRGVTVMSSHGPIIGGILRAMLDTRRPFPYEKGSVWVLDVRRGELTDANYLAPLS